MRSLDIVPVSDQATFVDDRSTLAACLMETPPRIPAWFGYDELGSELFEQITELPTYYLTRVERRLLCRHAAEIATLIDCGRVAELGSGGALQSPPTCRNHGTCWRSATTIRRTDQPSPISGSTISRPPEPALQC